MKQFRFMFGLSVVLALGLSAQHGFAQEPAVPGQAKPFVSGMFGDEMVLQRGWPVPVWGWAAPGQTVVVTAQGKRATAVAKADGSWRATLSALSVGKPFDVSVTGPGQSRTFHDVLAGDVWVCSGQSNMEFGIGNLTNAAREIAAADYPQIRLFKVGHDIAPEPHTQPQASWAVCKPDTVKQGGWNGFSAVGYFFGRDLYQALHVPIGLIESDWGGTPAEAWTSAEALATMPDFGPALAALAQQRMPQGQTPVDYATRLDAWYRKADPGSTPTSNWADPALDTAAWKAMTLPTAWEQAGVPALTAFDGTVWFRKTVELSADAAGRAAVLHLGPIDDNDTTYVNGVEVGRTEGYLTPRAYSLPAGALKAGPNVIAVRVLDTGGNGGLDGQAADLHLDMAGSPPMPLAGDWNYRVGTSLAQAGPPPMQITVDQYSPTVLYNGMIHPLLPYAIKGAIWYQGESNAGKAFQYRTLLPTMINDWRTRWGEGPFPFYIVQLANYQPQQPQPGESDWAELREAQSLTARTLPNSGIAVTIDIGNAADIHPKDKQDVGRRLALVALAKTYGQKIEYSGPEYKSMKRNGATLRVSFDHTTGGLVARGGALTGFAVAGPDHKFVWADARIDGSSVVVSSPQVPDPVAVRYAWAINPACNLYNGAGLPASPFRTDHWPGVTGGPK